MIVVSQHLHGEWHAHKVSHIRDKLHVSSVNFDSMIIAPPRPCSGQCDSSRISAFRC